MDTSSGLKLLKNSAVYSIMTFLKYSMGFLLLPLYTNYLTTTSYGVLSLVTSIIGVGVIVYSLSLDTAIAKFYYKRESDSDFKKYISSSSRFIIIFSFAFSFLLLLIYCVGFSGKLGEDISFHIFLLALISTTFQPLYNYYDAYLKALQEAKKSSILALSYFFFQLFLILVNVCFFKMQAEGVLLAGCITNFLFAFWSLIQLTKKNGTYFSWAYLRKLLKYSMPIVPHSLLGWAMNMTDRLFIVGMLTVASVGLYNISYQIGSILFIISTMAVHKAYGPWFLEQISQDKQSDIVRFSAYIVKAYCLICIVLSLFSPEIIQILTVSSDYYESWTMVPLLAISFLFYALYFLYINVFFIDKTSVLPKLTFVSFVFSCIANYIFIKFFGLIGASLSALLVKLFFALITYLYAQKMHYIPYKLKEIILYISLAVFISMLVYIIPMNNILLHIAIKLFIFGIVLVIYIWNNRNEVHFLSVMLTRKSHIHNF